MLCVFAIASLAVYGTSLAGWAQQQQVRAAGRRPRRSQMISYEVALGLGLVGMMMAFSTVRLPDLIAGQTALLWGSTEELGVLGTSASRPGASSCSRWASSLFFAAAFAETKRAPFDVPEGESEIIGYFVEYSGMKFGLFMISEFVEVVILAAITTALFFGGWSIGLRRRLAG